MPTSTADMGMTSCSGERYTADATPYLRRQVTGQTPTARLVLKYTTYTVDPPPKDKLDFKYCIATYFLGSSEPLEFLTLLVL